MKLSSQTILPFSHGSGPGPISKRLARVFNIVKLGGVTSCIVFTMLYMFQVIDKCVQYDPLDRYTVSSLLKSSFFTKMRSKSSVLETELLEKYTNCVPTKNTPVMLDETQNLNIEDKQSYPVKWLF